MWIFKGIIFGILFACIVDGIILLVELLRDDGYIKKRFFVIPTIIIFVVSVICGVLMQSADMWVDFYDDNGNIVETYEITNYDTKLYGDGVTFYLKDGRKIVKQDCIYEIRFEEDEVK